MTTVGHLVREAMLKLIAKAFPRGTAPYEAGGPWPSYAELEARLEEARRSVARLEAQLNDKTQVLAEAVQQLKDDRERLDSERSQANRLAGERNVLSDVLARVQRNLQAGGEAFAEQIRNQGPEGVVHVAERAVKELHRLWGAERDARDAGFADLTQLVSVCDLLQREVNDLKKQLPMHMVPGAASYQELREQVSRIGNLKEADGCPHHEVKTGCARCFNRIHVRKLAEFAELEDDLTREKNRHRELGHENNALKGHLKVAEDAAKRYQTFGEACLEALKVVAAQPRSVPTPGQEALLPSVLRSAVIWTVEQLEKKNCLDVLVGQEALRNRILDDLCLAVVKEVQP